MQETNGSTWHEERRAGTERRAGGGTLVGDERRGGADRREPPRQAWEGGPEIEGPDGPSPIVALRPDGGAAGRQGSREGEHDAIPSVAAIAGHPLHPMVVPIPIASLALTVVADLAYAATRDRYWARSARLLTTVGAASGVAAAALGGMDFLGRSRVRDHRAAWFHGGGNVAALVLSVASLFLRLRPRATPIPGPIILSAMAGAILLVTGWLGGELSYRHRIGVVREHAAE